MGSPAGGGGGDHGGRCLGGEMRQKPLLGLEGRVASGYP